MSRRSALGRLAVLLGVVCLPAGGGVEGQTVRDFVVVDDADPVVLTEEIRIGSLAGEHDAFGRVMDVALDGRGRIFVADDRAHAISVFDREGEFVGRIGRQGRGPGEFQSPWNVAVDARDSLFVWDTELARISVFGPSLGYVRSFRVPPHLLINSIEFLSDGRLLLAAFGPGEEAVLHVLDREGTPVGSFGEPPAVDPGALGGFSASLLGGTVDVIPHSEEVVYSKKSPYEVTFYTGDGEARLLCRGASDWTTDPRDVVVRRQGGVGLRWSEYVHSARVLALGSDLFLNVVMDPARDTRRIDLFDRECRILSRKLLDVPVSFTELRRQSLAAVRTVDYPEVVVYRLERSRSR